MLGIYTQIKKVRENPYVNSEPLRLSILGNGAEVARLDHLPNAEYLVILGVAIVVALLADLLAAVARRILKDRRRFCGLKCHRPA
jgi:hypothetical protein